MVDRERIIANAVENSSDDYGCLYDSDLMSSLSFTTKDLEKVLLEDDQENTQVSFPNGNSDEVGDVFDLLKSSEFFDLNEGCKVTVSEKFIPSQIIGSDPDIRLAFTERDLCLIPPSYSIIETALLYGDNFEDPCDTFARSFRRRCIEVIVKDRYECIFSFDELLAMLAHVCACPIGSLLPPGEVSLPGENYLVERLKLSELALVKTSYLKQICITRVKFLFELISSWDFMHYGEIELMLLIYACVKVYIDELADVEVKLLICNAVNNVLAGFSENQRRSVFYNFSSVFQYVDKSLEGLRPALRMMSNTPMLSPCKLFCLRRTLVRLVERGDLDPTSTELSDKEHFKAIAVLFDLFFQIFKKDRQQIFSVLNLFSESFDYNVMCAASPEQLAKLVERLSKIKRSFIREGSSNGAILERLIESILRRIDLWKLRKNTSDS